MLNERQESFHPGEPITVERKKRKKRAEVSSLWEHEPFAQIAVKVFRGHSDSVSSCQLCFHDTRLLTASHDQTARFWNVETGEQLTVFNGHSHVITRCCLVPEKNRAMTSSWDRTLNSWDLETGKLLWTVTHGGLLMSCSVSGDGKYVASASETENGLYVNCADTGQRIHYMKGHHRSTVMSCRFDPQCQRLASVSVDRSVRLWDLCAQKTLLTMHSAHTNVISNCCFNRDGRHLCTASWDRTLKLWDVQTGSFRSRGGLPLVDGHGGCVSSCTFSSDTAILVSGSYDKSTALWDLKGPFKILTLKGHKDWVTDVDISTDKTWVASSSKDCTVRMWNIGQYDQLPRVRKIRADQDAFPVGYTSPNTSSLGS